MKQHDVTEQAYKNGYEKGFADALLYAKEELRKIHMEIDKVYKAVKELGGDRDG